MGFMCLGKYDLIVEKKRLPLLLLGLREDGVWIPTLPYF